MYVYKSTHIFVFDYILIVSVQLSELILVLTGLKNQELCCTEKCSPNVSFFFPGVCDISIFKCNSFSNKRTIERKHLNIKISSVREIWHLL